MAEPIVPALLTTQQAAEYLGISERSVRNLITAGELRRVKITERATRVRRTDLDRLIARRTEPAPGEKRR